MCARMLHCASHVHYCASLKSTTNSPAFELFGNWSKYFTPPMIAPVTVFQCPLPNNISCVGFASNSFVSSLLSSLLHTCWYYERSWAECIEFSFSAFQSSLPKMYGMIQPPSEVLLWPILCLPQKQWISSRNPRQLLILRLHCSGCESHQDTEHEFFWRKNLLLFFPLQIVSSKMRKRAIKWL